MIQPIKLPKPVAALASYVPYVIVDNYVYISGQLPIEEGQVKYIGKVGDAVSQEEAIEAAKLCALNTLAHLEVAAGSLDKVKRCIKLTGFVNAISEFTTHPKIINGASDLMVSVFGENGKHARSAVGVSSLPFNSSVELESIWELYT